MGYYEDLNFRESVVDILDNWDFYSVQPQCLNEGLTTEPNPAYNAGNVQIQCYINNVCPFYRTPYRLDTIVFNTSTVNLLQEKLPVSVTGNLTTTPGLEGMHFKHRKVFRHNYVSKLNLNPDKEDERYNIHADMTERFMNFDLYYEDITAKGTSVVTGADVTRYRPEYTWAVVDSVFDSMACNGETVEECHMKVNWKYIKQPLSVNRMTQRDISYDYPLDYWNDYKDGYEFDEDTSSFKLKDGKTNLIEKFYAQMPIQAQTHAQDKSGIHWRLTKSTPVFRGADFFIRFYKQSKKSVTHSNSFGVVPFSKGLYTPLDYSSNDIVAFDNTSLDGSGNRFKKYANNAVRLNEGEEGDEQEENKPNIYDLYTQAYYIIEMQEKYFIIITERGNPIFVEFYNHKDSSGIISRVLGAPYEGISGSKLINAEYFDVIVRNHLGRIVIQFEGEGFNESPPWIIEKRDWNMSVDDKGNGFLVDGESAEIFVPKGFISLWGGNIRCGFIFGILQYETSYISFVYPPRVTNNIAAKINNEGQNISIPETMLTAFENITPEEIEFSTAYFTSEPLWFPMNGPIEDGRLPVSHRITFEAYDGPNLPTGTIGEQYTEFPNEPLFTQDAQYYKNYSDNIGDYEWRLGYFHYNYPIKEFSPQLGRSIDGSRGHVKTSNIVIQKYKYFNYEKTKHQGFDTFIGMMCGDHLFNDEYYDTFFNPKPEDRNKKRGKWDMVPPTPELFPIQKVGVSTWNSPNVLAKDLNDEAWYLPDCKTPILTHVKIASDFSPDPRWEDGTTIKDGINRDPGHGKSGYFIDASDHVMSFSHAWSSADATSLEHSGSIQFYLNEDVDFGAIEGVSNNKTYDLISLQDRTFYIEVWAGYSLSSNDEVCNYTKIPGFYKLFTGLCKGGSISYEYGKTIMTCQLQDYSVVLKGTRFFNSPWFDGMKDIVAIRDILQFAGFRDQGEYDPATLVSNLAESAIAMNSQLFFNHFDGRNFKFNTFALPSGYNRLHQPAFKFKDGDPYDTAIKKICEKSSKLFYFDEFGIAHYENYQDLVEADFEGKMNLVPLYSFTSNPEINAGQLVFNKIDRSYEINDVVNHLKLLTNTPDMHLLIRDHIKWESIENPEINGFLGYQSTFFQQESMFGSKEAQIEAMNKYAVFFKGKIKIKFETYGLPLRATDIVSIDGEVVRVSKVDHTLDASKNQWWMSIECVKYQSIDQADLIPRSELEE